MAAAKGFEPLNRESKSRVLPIRLSRYIKDLAVSSLDVLINLITQTSYLTGHLKAM